MSKRYIEIASGYRNRNNWPCPAQFVVPIDCRNRTEDPLEAYDPLVLGYTIYAWYQVPYAAPLWQETGLGITQPRPRNINGIYYTSLWPLTPTLDQLIPGTPPPSKSSGWLGAMHFSGGTFEKPALNSKVVSPENVWQSTGGSGANIVYNPYYTPQNNYFSGALLIRFTEDPSCTLNSWNNSQLVNILAPFAIPPVIGNQIEQPGVGASGTIVCIISPISFVVTLQTNTPFDPTGGNIEIPSSGAIQTPDNFSTLTTNAYSYNGTVETSIITSYDGITGIVTLSAPFSEDFDPLNDYFLIDFNTDPNNDWADYVSGGARIFVPGGSNAQQAYEGLYFQNYTLSSETTNMDIGANVIKYDFVRKLAYLDKPLPLKNQQGVATNVNLYGSNTFTIRKKPSLETKTFDKISICNGSIMELNVMERGSGYQVGQTIGTSFTLYYDSPGGVPQSIINDYNVLTNTGKALSVEITNVDSNGGILKLKVVQQGVDFRRAEPLIVVSNGLGLSGNGAKLIAYNVYQSIEVYRNSNLDSSPILEAGNFIYLPTLGKIGIDGLNRSNMNVVPNMPRYFFPPNNLDVTNSNTIDIRQSGYPPTVTSCDAFGNVNIPTTGIYQIVKSFAKNVTFGDWYDTAIIPTPVNPITVFYLQNQIDINTSGLTDSGQPVFVPNSTLPQWTNNSTNGYLQSQQIEYLQYNRDNLHPLNFTGTRVSQSQAVCFRIKLISITLPNIPLDTVIGGLIAFYPYLYVELSNVNSPMRGNKGIIYSNNPNANRALFKVNVSDTNTPLRSKFIKLRAGGTIQTVKFTPNDDLYFRVYLKDGTLFETQQKDTSPPLPPDFFVQISAQFEIDRVDYPYGKTSTLHLHK